MYDVTFLGEFPSFFYYLYTYFFNTSLLFVLKCIVFPTMVQMVQNWRSLSYFKQNNILYNILSDIIIIY